MGELRRDRLFRFLHDLGERLRSMSDAGSMLRSSLRSARDFFGASEGCAVVREAPGCAPSVEYSVPHAAEWHGIDLGAFVAGEYPKAPENVIGAAVRRYGRSWAAFVLRRGRAAGESRSGGAGGARFEPGEGRLLARVTARVSEALAAHDAARAAEVRERLDRKIMEQLRPRDLFYQVLHALRTLTRYDHSSTLLIGDPAGQDFELAAEQLACRKGKSRRIGQRLALEERHRWLLDTGVIRGFDRESDGWREWTQGAPAAARAGGSEALANWLDLEGARRAESELPPVGALLCVPVTTRLGAIGAVRIASLRRGAFGAYEAGIVRQLGPHASVAIQYLQRTEALERQMLAAEKKHAMATIARGVSHDVNNALGAVLPLVQQLRAEAGGSQTDARRLEEDLAQIEQSLQTSRRIFGGMLNLARSATRTVGEGNLRRAIDGALAILGDGMRRRGVAVTVDLPEDLPSVNVGQGDLSQLFLNLASNARDAMPDGGRLTVSARRCEAGVEITLLDTGGGIAPAMLARIGEPFVSTKADGNGLGLSICRSIVWEARGRMTIENAEGGGALVRVTLPAHPSESPRGRS